MDNVANRTPADIIAGTPINEPGVVYLYRATDSTHVWLELTNRETLDAVRDANPLAIRKLYAFSPAHLDKLGRAPVSVVAAAAARLAELERQADMMPLTPALQLRRLLLEITQLDNHLVDGCELARRAQLVLDTLPDDPSGH